MTDENRADEPSAAAGRAAEPAPSAAAKAGERRFSRGERILIVVVLAMALLALTAFAIMLTRVVRGRPGDRMPATRHVDYTYLDNKEFGSLEAKVHVLVALPLAGCQGPAIEYVAKAAQAYPEHVHARFLEFFSPRGKEEATKVSGGPPCVAINGSDRFTRPSGEAIRLGGPLNEDYTVEDIRLALQAKFTEVYGAEAPALPPSGETGIMQP